MSMDRSPVTLEMSVSCPSFQVGLRLLSTTQLTFEIREAPFSPADTVEIQVIARGDGIFAAGWEETSGAPVTGQLTFQMSAASLESLQPAAMRRSIELRRNEVAPIARPSGNEGDAV